MLNNFSKKPKYLVYQVGSCEMGSEGASSRYFFCVAEGDTKEEVIQNWVENVELLYGHKPNPKYNEESDSYYDYYPIYMNKLVDRYSNALAYDISIIDRYRIHDPNYRFVEERYNAEQ